MAQLGLRTGQIDRRMDMSIQPVRVIEDMQNPHETAPNTIVDKYKFSIPE
ncbi:hypothetical protein [Rhizobium sp.]